MKAIQLIWNKAFLIITLCFIVIINIALASNDYDLLYMTLAVIPVCLAIYFMLLESYHFILLIAFLAPLSIPINLAGGSQLYFPSELIIGLFTILFLAKNLHTLTISKKILTHPLTLILLADLSWMLIACIFSNIPLVSFKRLFVRCCFLTVFYFGFSSIIQSPQNFLKVFIAYAIGTIIPVIYAVVFLYRHDFIIMAHTQMTKPFFVDHGLFGACMAFITPFAVIAFLHIKGLNKLVLFSILLIVVSGLFFSYSRASWMSLCVAGVMYFLIWIRIKVPVILLSVSILFLLAFIFRNDIESYSKANDSVSNKDLFQHVKSVGNVKTDASNTERINRWKSAGRMFADRPFTGFGPGTYQFIYSRYQSHSDLTRISTFSGDKGSCHSEYLTYLSETGLPGFIIFLILVLYSFQIALKNIYRSKGMSNYLSIAAFLGLITFYVHGLFNNFIDSDKMALLVIGSLSVLMWVDNYLSDEDAKEIEQEKFLTFDISKNVD